MAISCKGQPAEADGAGSPAVLVGAGSPAVLVLPPPAVLVGAGSPAVFVVPPADGSAQGTRSCGRGPRRALAQRTNLHGT